MFLGNLVKKNSKLGYSNGKDKLLYELFLNSINEGEEVEIFICKKGDKASTAQIAKVHACIRELAKESGYTFEEMKDIVKGNAGLCSTSESADYCKSFANCSKDELMLAIEACIEIGKSLNVNLQ